MRVLNFIVALFCTALLLSGCTGKRYNMLHTAADSETSIGAVGNGVPALVTGQELCITVSSLNEESARYFRTTRERQGATGIECLYYQIDANGAVDIPLIGEVKIGGMSLEEAEEILTDKLDKLLKEPAVRIEHTGFEVSVLGEVKLPGVFNEPTGRVTLFEAIARAGGMDQFGRRDNVLIIREVDNEIKHIRVDLTKDELWKTDYYYLRQDDVVMVSSNSGRITNSKNLTAIGSIFIGLGTVAAIIVTR